MKLKTRIFLCVFLLINFSLTALLYSDVLVNVDTVIYENITDLISHFLTVFMLAFTYLGSTYGIITIILVLLLLPKTRNVYGLPVGLSVALCNFFNLTLKNLFARPRPEILRLTQAGGYSFPSGHAMNNSCLYFLIFFIFLRTTKNSKMKIPVLVVALFLTFIIGFSRVYLGVHYFTDVFAGWVLGISLALIADYLWSLIISKT